MSLDLEQDYQVPVLSTDVATHEWSSKRAERCAVPLIKTHQSHPLYPAAVQDCKANLQRLSTYELLM